MKNTSDLFDENSLPPDLPEDSNFSYDPRKSRRWLFASSAIPSLKSHAIPDLKSDSGLVDPAADADVPCVDAPPSPQRGGFALRKLVGSGGFGEVWEAVQVNLNRIVAVKRLRPDIRDRIEDPEEVSRIARLLEMQFRQEALTTAQLAHPNILPVHDLGMDEAGNQLMAMKYIRGRPWDKLLEEDARSLEPDEFLSRHISILIQVTQAVAFAHSRGVIHRDLKPAQVMVGEFGEVLLADWGLSVVFDYDALAQVESCVRRDFLPTPETATNPAGTPAFMAPEQTRESGREIGTWTDVYLLGGTLYYILTLHPPHTGADSKEAFLKARLGEVPHPSIANPSRDVPPELAALAMDALRPEIKGRIQTPTEFLQRLREHQSGSSRRRRSQMITEAVEERLEIEQGDYRVYSESLAQLARAWGLWAENPDIPRLKRRAHLEMGHLALENRDLVLAHLQAENIDTEEDRQELQERIRQANTKVHRRERQRRLAIMGVCILLALVVTVISGAALRVSRARDRAVEESIIAWESQQQAEHARTDAQKLVSFMLNDLLESMAPSGQLEPLLEVSLNVLNYFDQLPREQMTVETRMLKAEALCTTGLIYRAMGDSDSALRYFQDYHTLAGQLYEQDSTSMDFMGYLAYSDFLIGEVKSELGDPNARRDGLARALAVAAGFIANNRDKGLIDGLDPDRMQQLAVRLDHDRTFSSLGDDRFQVLAILDQLNAWGGDQVQFRNDLTYVYKWIGETAISDGDLEMAQRALSRALEKRQQFLEQNPANTDVLLSVVIAHIDLGKLALVRGDHESAETSLRKAVSLSETVDESSRFYVDIFTQRAVANRLVGRSLLESGQLEASLESSNLAVTDLRRLARRDPQNAMFQRELLLAWQQVGNVFARLQFWSQADSAFANALPLAESLAARDPRNTEWRSDIVALFKDYVAIIPQLDAGGGTDATGNACDLLRMSNERLPAEMSAEKVAIYEALDAACK